MNFTKSPPIIRKFKFWLLGSLCLILLSTHASLSQNQAEEKIPFEYPVQIPKVDLKTQNFLDGLPTDSAVAVWVFFKDKGIRSFAQYRSALDEYLSRLSERSLRRRMLRGGESWVDFTDIPVKKQYLNELENLGAKIGKDTEIVVDKHMRTNIPGIYASGDVIGPPYEMYKARQTGMVAAENIKGRETDDFDPTKFPSDKVVEKWELVKK